jgi:hypothetical protein
MKKSQSMSNLLLVQTTTPTTKAPSTSLFGPAKKQSNA